MDFEQELKKVIVIFQNILIFWRVLVQSVQLSVAVVFNCLQLILLF